jgi:DNA-binding transcriptional LysR family regulator
MLVAPHTIDRTDRVELRHLRYFVAVAEECHFGRAAHRLHIAQPPLSQQIKQLEAELGVRLLARSTRRVELTPAGAQYLDRARDILGRVDAAGEEAALVADGRIGRVALGFTGSATYELLPRLSRALRAELPGLRLDLRGEMLTPDQVAGLRTGALDVGILRPPVHDDGVEAHLLRREPLRAVLPDAHPLAGDATVRLADLAEDPFIAYPSGARSVVHDAVAEACRAAGFELRATEVAETSTLVSFVAAGLGVALVPASVEHLRITGATYRRLEGIAPSVELAVATRRGEDSAAVRRVIGIVRSTLRDTAGE